MSWRDHLTLPKITDRREEMVMMWAVNTGGIGFFYFTVLDLLTKFQAIFLISAFTGYFATLYFFSDPSTDPTRVPPENREEVRVVIEE